MEKLPNYDMPEGMSLEQLVSQEVAKAEARIKALNLKSKSNSIQLGCTVMRLENREGSEMKDKKTGELMTDDSGQIRRFANKFYVTLAFKGGSLVQEIKSHEYDMLQENNDYFCTGYMGEVSNFGKVEIAPIITQFENLSV